VCCLLIEESFVVSLYVRQPITSFVHILSYTVIHKDNDELRVAVCIHSSLHLDVFLEQPMFIISLSIHRLLLHVSCELNSMIRTNNHCLQSLIL
jgi:hypothetical protein